MAELTLGIDLGPTSIGWALVDELGKKIVAAGVRVFPEGVDRPKGLEVSKNETRRIARGMRRQIARRARRKFKLRLALVEAGLLPEVALWVDTRYARRGLVKTGRVAPESDFAPLVERRQKWESARFAVADPYELRARALSERIDPFDLGRVFLHLNARRGFRSNRKTDRARKAAEQGEMLKQISALEAEMAGRTLGAYLQSLRGDDRERHHLTRVRGKHTRREMLESEFDRIWDAQAAHHAALAPELRERIRDLIFFQRRLRPPSPSLVGRCELVPRLPRCPRADRRAQRFRLFQEVNNLRVLDSSARAPERPLSSEERSKLIEVLGRKKELSFDKIRELFEQRANVRFNLERGDRKNLKGMGVDCALASKALLGKAWWGVADELRDHIVAAIVDDNADLLSFWLNKAGLDASKMGTILDKCPLPSGYANYSLFAIKKLLPHVERGLPLTSRDKGVPCALREAGFPVPWERSVEQAQQLGDPPAVANPIVRQALHQVRKVVNAILREYIEMGGNTLGRIHIELAREAKGTAEQRARRSREMRDRERARNSAKELIAERGIRPGRDAQNRYLLWNEQDKLCIYSGRCISLDQLFGGEVEIDHILPYSRSLDDSMMNKVACFRDANRDKGDQTPYEWLAGRDPERYEHVIQRSRGLPFPKQKRFLQQSLELDECIARQLVDTTYITTQVVEYVRCLAPDVVASHGHHTAELRHQWGLDRILQVGDLAIKNREDHRHHAVDAIVIALTSRARLQNLARIRRFGGTARTGEVLAPPWESLRDDAERVVNSIVVSHRPKREIHGALHEETFYGPTDKPHEFVVRKPVEQLTPANVERIRDPAIKKLVIARLSQFGVEPGRGSKSKIGAEVWREPLRMPSGIPIRRVRVLVEDESIVPLRGGTVFVKPGSVHHCEVFERNGRREAVYVSMLEAARRARSREPIICRAHPEQPDARFLWSLSPGDLLLREVPDGTGEVVLVTTLVSTEHNIRVARANDARPSSTRKVWNSTPNSLHGRKITVDPLGRVRWSKD
ncbi:MAG: type II CRISPR RNA-guided endonuclease Cas9 [Phycisphaerae bacterium]